MKKIKFTLSTGYINSEVTEIIEFEDDASEEEIDAVYKDWMVENCYGDWEEVEE